MKWIKINEDLPNDGDMVCVKIPNKKPFICIYKNDSFGLGDTDFQVSCWCLLKPLDLTDHLYSLQSISRVLGHTNADSLGLQQRLA